MRTWFTADLHLGHANVIKYAERPFADVEEMNTELVRRWKAIVQPKDHVYLLGDFYFGPRGGAGPIIRDLPGVKYLVPGNHDKHSRKDGFFTLSFKWVKDLAEISVEGQHIVLCHYALLTWNRMHYSSWMLHGHSHGSLKENPNARRLDVGVDCWNYAPVSFEEIKDAMTKKTFQPTDHHGTKKDAEHVEADEAAADGEAGDPGRADRGETEGL